MKARIRQMFRDGVTLTEMNTKRCAECGEPSDTQYPLCARCRHENRVFRDRRRGPWDQCDTRSLIQSVMPAVEAACKKWGPPCMYPTVSMGRRRSL